MLQKVQESLAVVEKELENEIEEELEDEARVYDIPGTEYRLPMKSPAFVRKFVRENEALVHDVFYQAIERAVDEDLDEVILFWLGESELMLKFERKNYETLLRRFQEYFIRSEQYEKVIQCKQLRDKLFVNRVIDESKN